MRFNVSNVLPCTLVRFNVSNVHYAALGPAVRVNVSNVLPAGCASRVN